MSCPAVLKTGSNKGSLCGLPVKKEGKCLRHAKMNEDPVSPGRPPNLVVVPSDLPFFGEVDCVAHYATGEKKGQSCTRKAYYFDTEPKCGIHCSKTNWFELPKRLIDEVALKKEQDDAIEVARLQNVAARRPGTVLLYRMGMMKKVESRPGFLNVFPNYRHGNRKDGLGMPNLSPMRLGPVHHGQPGLPEARTIEGFHQYSKLYEEETLISPDGNHRILGPLFLANRLEGMKLPPQDVVSSTGRTAKTRTFP